MKKTLQVLGLVGIVSATVFSGSQLSALVQCESTHGSYCPTGSRGGPCISSSGATGFCRCVGNTLLCSWS